MVDKVEKCKKKKGRRIKWNDLRLAINDPLVNKDYFVFLCHHKKMSLNRCSFYVLKTYYSTTAIKAMRKLYEVNGFSYEDIAYHLFKYYPLNLDYSEIYY